MELKSLKTNHPQDAWSNFKDGNFAALGIFFETYYHELYYYGIKTVSIPELVKDAIQDLFTDLWERRDKMTEIKNFKAYLLISLRRELIRRINHIRKETPAGQLPILQFSFSTEDFLIHDEENRQHSKLLTQSMEGLTERQREVILLRFFHGLEFPEISQVLGMNIQSVRNLLFRALDKIRKDMSEKGVTGIESAEMFLWMLFQQKR